MDLCPVEEELLHASRVEMLGHCIGKEGIHTNERKVQNIRDAHPPSNRKQLKYFHGIVSYSQRFFKNLPKIAGPVTEKTSEKVDFNCTPPIQKSFNTLKQALSTAPVLLAYPYFSKPFLVATDASRAAVGAVLSQLE